MRKQRWFCLKIMVGACEALTIRIWGFWGPDDKSPIIWNNTQTLLGNMVYGWILFMMIQRFQYRETTQKFTIGTKQLVN